MNIGIKQLACGVALALASTVALADVTFDPSTGIGWVGKGDVQTPFAYNNAAMQKHHQHVYFTYSNLQFKMQECVDNNQGVKTHVGYRVKSKGVSAVLDSTSRKTGQWTGWHLTGTNGGDDGSLEWDDDDQGWTTHDGSPAQPNGCPIIEGDKSQPSGKPAVIESYKGLYANDFDAEGAKAHLIWAPPAPVAP